jgi:hypothetical protein
MGHPEVKWSIVSSYCLHNRHLLSFALIIIIIIISFMKGIYIYIPETNNVPKEYNVAAILSLLCMVPTINGSRIIEREGEWIQWTVVCVSEWWVNEYLIGNYQWMNEELVAESKKNEWM